MEEELAVRAVNQKDVDLLFKWANNETARQNSFNSEKITYKEHTSWLERKLNDKNCYFYIFEKRHSCIGQVRFQIEKDNAVISISLDEKFRGEGLGSKMIVGAINHFYKEASYYSIKAYIKKGNIASLKTFKKAGFTFLKEDYLGQIPCYLLIKY